MTESSRMKTPTDYLAILMLETVEEYCILRDLVQFQ